MNKRSHVHIFFWLITLLLSGIVWSEVSFADNTAMTTVIPPTCTILISDLSSPTSDSTASGQVSTLQNFLYNHGYLTVSPTGFFGPLTLQAVQEFQRDNNLNDAGFVGPLTRKRIQDISCEPVPVQASTSLSTTSPTEIPVPHFASTSLAVPLTTPSTTPLQLIIPDTSTSTITASTTSISLPYSASTFSIGTDWLPTWGSIYGNSDGTMNIAASTSTMTTGGQAILSGSNNLANYMYTTNATVTNGSNLILISRYHDSQNFLSCTFADQYVSLDQTLDGNTTTLAETTVRDVPSALAVLKNVSVAMSANGPEISCYVLGNTPALTAHVTDPRLTQGGVGIQTWSRDPGTAHIQLKSVNIQSM